MECPEDVEKKHRSIVAEEGLQIFQNALSDVGITEEDVTRVSEEEVIHGPGAQVSITHGNEACLVVLLLTLLPNLEHFSFPADAIGDPILRVLDTFSYPDPLPRRCGRKIETITVLANENDYGGYGYGTELWSLCSILTLPKLKTLDASNVHGNRTVDFNSLQMNPQSFRSSVTTLTLNGRISDSGLSSFLGITKDLEYLSVKW